MLDHIFHQTLAYILADIQQHPLMLFIYGMPFIVAALGGTRGRRRAYRRW